MARTHNFCKIEFMLLADYIVLIFLVIFFILGWRRGFLRTLFGPISFFLGLSIGSFYYFKTFNIAASILIIFIASFFLHMGLSRLLDLFRKVRGEGEGKAGFSIGRLLAGVFNSVWQGLFLIATLLIIPLLPSEEGGLFESAQDHIVASQTYTVADNWPHAWMSSQFDAKRTFEILRDPSSMERIKNSSQYQALIKNERITALLSDERIKKNIETHNYLELLNNHKVQEVLNNRDLVKNLLSLNRKIIRQAKESQETD